MKTGQRYTLFVKLTKGHVIDGDWEERYDTIGDDITISDARMLISRYIAQVHWRVAKFTLEPING